MRIVDVKVNHFNNPIGYYIDKPCISWKIEDTISEIQEDVSINISLTYNMKEII